MHLCEQPMNLTRRACCHLVLLLNDTSKARFLKSRVPLCTVDEFLDNSTRVLRTPVYLAEPAEEREDHVTFVVGIFLLMLIALGCTFTLSKLTKPKISVGYGTSSNYDVMMWMPSSYHRRSSVLVLLRGMTCRRDPSNRESSVSVVSSHVPLLPSYQTATTTPTSSLPPPPYSEDRPILS
ncbi:unnamed protein product [Caenorhabditis auriculariae]|uniref:Uncharacterized protein n=1 Tax=Caenorhabditis auriculariae TaxID=2777116 RepID=A0A8S1HU66_9PELO|nr:unnamed protein product [Caenorhabditis auriculariae]